MWRQIKIHSLLCSLMPGDPTQRVMGEEDACSSYWDKKCPLPFHEPVTWVVALSRLYRYRGGARSSSRSGRLGQLSSAQRSHNMIPITDCVSN